MKTATIQPTLGPQRPDDGGELLTTARRRHPPDAPRVCAAGIPTATIHITSDSHQPPDGGTSLPEPASHRPNDALASVAGGFGELRTWARMLDDVEHVRITFDLRIHALRRGDAALLQSRAELYHVECALQRQVERAYKATRFYLFTRPVPGIGAKTMGRIIAEVGDPALRAIGHFEKTGIGEQRAWIIDSHTPRRAGQFLSYCGVGDPTRKRKAGQTANWNNRAKALILEPSNGLAAQIMKHRPEPYRSIYDDRKARYIAEHPDWPLLRCELSARKVAVKRFLIDLWAYARDTLEDE